MCTLHTGNALHTDILGAGADSPLLSLNAMHTGMGRVDTPSVPTSLELTTQGAEHALQCPASCQYMVGQGWLAQSSVDVGLVSPAPEHSVGSTTVGGPMKKDRTVDTHCVTLVLNPVSAVPQGALQVDQAEVCSSRAATTKKEGR